MNSKETIPIWRTLEILGHSQPPDGTPFKMNNEVTTGFIHSNIKQKQSKSWDIKYHWMRERGTQKQIRYYWDKGINNEADYFSRHHPPKHHIDMRPKYILKGHLLTEKICHLCTKKFQTNWHPDTS